MKNAGLFAILFFRRKIFEKSTCFLLAGLFEKCMTEGTAIDEYGGSLFCGKVIQLTY